MVSTLPWMVNPSTTTLLALTIVPCPSAMTDSAPTRVRASTPACAPQRVTVLLMTRGPAPGSVYVPAATAMTSPTAASFTAPWIVLHPVPQQPGPSAPVASSTRQVGVAHADAAHAPAAVGHTSGSEVSGPDSRFRLSMRNPLPSVAGAVPLPLRA